MSYGTLDKMSQQINYANTWLYGGQVYGVPSTATTQGIVYNKKVFEDAGVTDVPKTPDEFIDALKKIKDKNGCNSALHKLCSRLDNGSMGCLYREQCNRRQYIFQPEISLHTKDPFKNYGDDTHAYAVYKILYDAVARGLTEDDYSTTDWEAVRE